MPLRIFGDCDGRGILFSYSLRIKLKLGKLLLELFRSESSESLAKLFRFSSSTLELFNGTSFSLSSLNSFSFALSIYWILFFIFLLSMHICFLM